MTRKIYLLRHAQSADKQQGQSDKDRVLTMRGIDDVKQLGGALKKNNINFELIISSSATRAKSTALLMAEAMSYEPEKIQWHDLLYEASALQVLQIIRQLPVAIRSVLIVGHNPSISEAAFQLTSDFDGDLLPCGLAIIAFGDREWNSVSPRSGKLLQL